MSKPEVNLGVQALYEVALRNVPAAKREWVGLSEQERVQIAIDAGCMSADWVDFAEAIEKALKEKNT